MHVVTLFEMSRTITATFLSRAFVDMFGELLLLKVQPELVLKACGSRRSILLHTLLLVHIAVFLSIQISLDVVPNLVMPFEC